MICNNFSNVALVIAESWLESFTGYHNARQRYPSQHVSPAVEGPLDAFEGVLTEIKLIDRQ
jgi:hypothetical protein